MGDKNDGVNPSGKGADYQNWSWKEIKVAVCGAVDTSHTNELSERHMVSEPQTFYDAADHFDIVKDKLQSAKDDTERYTKALIGTEHDGWKGPTANAFRDMMNKFKGAYEGHLSPLAGPPSYRTTLEGAAAKLQKAIDDISTIDGDVAGKVMDKWKKEAGPFAAIDPPWRTEADGTTIVAVSKYPDLVDEMTRRMRPVIQDLHNGYAVSTDDLPEPSDVNYPSTGNGNGPNNKPPPPHGPPPPNYEHGGPPPPVVNLAKPPPGAAPPPPPPPLDHAGPPPPDANGPLGLDGHGAPGLDGNGPLGPDGKPLLGPHGELLGPDGKPMLGAHGELLNQAGAPLLDGAGKPIFGLADPATKLADLGGLRLPGAGGGPAGLPGGALPGGLSGGSTGLSGLAGGPLLPTRPGLPLGRVPGGNLGRVPGGKLGRLGRGLRLPGAGAGKLTSGELGPRSRSALLDEGLFGEQGQPGMLGRRELAERQRAGSRSGFPAEGGAGEGALGRNGMPGQGGTGSGSGDGEDERERETWLEEDRDVWGAGGAPVGTLGRPED
ncbi:MAG: hypothetical protein V7637_700 [Mycobacteriales bacterium]|jgi:hypothetical protein